MLPAAGARRSAYVPVAGAAARGAVWPRRRRLDPVELDHHLTSPTSRESQARTHARTHARTRKHTGHGLENASTCSCRPGQVGHAVSCAGRARATSHRRKALNGAITEEERRAT